MSDEHNHSGGVSKADDSCRSCGVGGKGEEFQLKKELLILGLGVFIYVVALISRLSAWVELSLFLLSYFIIARDIVWTAVRNVFRGRVFDENFLLTVATAGAFAIDKYPEAVAVMLFFRVGEMFENIALKRSRRSIKSLIGLRPDYANLKIDGETRKTDPNEVNIGATIVVKPGEKVPLDGVVLEGNSLVDTSALTGEPVPRKVKPASAILSGMINKTGLLVIRVTKKFSESTMSRILDLIEHASAKKAPTEKFITKFARYYTPAVVFGAFILAVVPVLLYHIPALQPLFHHRETFSEWIYKALIFLVIACPCALVISIPLGFFGGIGASAKQGILVKGANFLEGMNNLHTVVWDKTGTLTKGVFRVARIVLRNGFSRAEILAAAAEAESHSNHPIAQSILEAFKGKIEENKIENYEEISGYGVKAKIDGHDVLVGNDKLLHREKVEHDSCEVEGTVVHVAVDHKYAGYIIISDEVKKDARLAVQGLKDLGVKRQIMLTGDGEEAAKKVARELGLESYFAGLLPQEKLEKIEELLGKKMHRSEQIAFIGDGINDAPVLRRADIGIAMGALGADAAIEAADIVLMTDEPAKVARAVKVAGRTRKIVWQNIWLALGVKGLILIIGVLGMVTIWEAVFADVGVALLAILNSTRVLKVAG